MSRIKQPIGTKTSWLYGIVGIALLFLGYSWLSYRQHQKNPDDSTIPNFAQLVGGIKQVTKPQKNELRAAFGTGEDDGDDRTWWERTTSTMLYKDATSTYKRLLIGLTLGCVLSVLVGVAMGCYASIEAVLLPPLSFLAKVPGTAMLAVFFVMVGTGEGMFTTMIAFGILPTLAVAVYLSAKHDLHEEEIFKAYTLGASNMEVICNIVYPQILPKVLEAIRLQIGPAMVYLIAAEMLVGEVGLGYQIRMQQRLLNMAVVYDYIIILGATGLLMDRGMLALRRYLCPWYSRWR